jgi:cytochrome c biogenesis protein
MTDSLLETKVGNDSGQQTGSSAFPYTINRVLRTAGSLRATLVLLVLLTVAVIWVVYNPAQATATLALPLGLLALNLTASILSHPLFKRWPGLLVFHLSLLLIILLVAIGRMTYLKGWTEVTEGAAFKGELTGGEAGPWHPWHLDEVVFVNEGFEINYQPGPRRTHTYNRVGWVEDGNVKRIVIGDQQPLVLEGYRFYTSFNKGFAPHFTWQPAGGEAVSGNLHLPSYPANKHRQTAEWAPPGSQAPLWFMLSFDEEILSRELPSVFHPPEQHRLVVREGERRFELAPGESLSLQEGQLVYHGLKSWMGYTVYYDWTRPWLVATCLAAVFGLGWHLWERYFCTPWKVD